MAPHVSPSAFLFKSRARLMRSQCWLVQSVLHKSRARVTGPTEATSGGGSFSSHHAARILQTRSFWGISAPETKPYYVTTPIFYVNAAPHIGHMYSMFLADTLKRWQMVLGHKALLSTGTDEHGSKVQQAAEAAGLEPHELCRLNSEKFRLLADHAGISYDFFVRTSDVDHFHAVQAFWKLLDSKGLIYKATHEGWYSISDEAFYSESEVHDVVNPRTQIALKASKATGSKVEWVAEETYRFRLSEFRSQLLVWFKENPGWIQPRGRMDEMINWVVDNLTDLSVSRPSSRVSWGVPVPGDEQHTVYIWVDALVNYICKAGYPAWTDDAAMRRGGWPADVQVVGKDIARFHCVYWPALLMAADLPLPRQVLVHGHWQMNGRKMSKSLGNVVDPFAALERWDPDALRYFMISQGCIDSDSDYGNQLITVKYQKDLQHTMGNMLSRVTLSKRWNVREAVEACLPASGLPEHSAMRDVHANMPKQPTVILPVIAMKNEPGHLNIAKVKDAILNQQSFVSNIADRASMRMGMLDLVQAVRVTMDVISEGNRFLTTTEPWNLAELPQKELLHATIYTAAETLRTTGILMQAFMPLKAAELLDQLGVAEDKRTISHARLGADRDYGAPLSHVVKPVRSQWTGLFPKLPLEEITVEEALERLKSDTRKNAAGILRGRRRRTFVGERL